MVATGSRDKESGDGVILADHVGQIQRLPRCIAASKRVDGVRLGEPRIDPVA